MYRRSFESWIQELREFGVGWILEGAVATAAAANLTSPWGGFASFIGGSHNIAHIIRMIRPVMGTQQPCRATHDKSLHSGCTAHPDC